MLAWTDVRISEQPAIAVRAEYAGSLSYLLLAQAPDAIRSLLDDEAMEPSAVAEEVLKGLADERFLILPHPQVAEYFRRKGDDYDRWIRGMRRLQQRVVTQ